MPSTRMPLTVRDYEPRDLSEIAAVRARAHARARAVTPALPAAYEDPGACVGLLTHALLDDDADIAVAERDGRIVGFLGGTRSMPAPDSFWAQYTPPHSISIPVAGHGIDDGEPAVEVYRALYAHLSARWAEDGFFFHQAGLLTSDPAARDAWFLLGFGANVTLSYRDLSPLRSAANTGGIELRDATVDDLPAIQRMDELESLHHREPPIFWPHLGRDVAAAVEAFQRTALGNPKQRLVIAWRGTEPLGMHFLMGEGGFGGPAVSPERSVYLYQAIVEPDARGQGVGNALLAHTVEWARAEGYSAIVLHYASMNPSGTPYWEGHGFVPLEITVERHLDERIAWARRR